MPEILLCQTICTGKKLTGFRDVPLIRLDLDSKPSGKFYGDPDLCLFTWFR